MQLQDDTKIIFDELNFKEFINGDLFGLSLEVDMTLDSDDDDDDDDSDDDRHFYLPGPKDIIEDKLYQHVYKIKESYVKMVFNGMVPFLMSTNFKITNILFRAIEKCDGVEFWRCLSHYRGIICFGKMFDAKEQQNHIRRTIQELRDIECRAEKLLETSLNSTTIT